MRSSAKESTFVKSWRLILGTSFNELKTAVTQSMAAIGNVVTTNVSDTTTIIHVSFFLILVSGGTQVFMVVKDARRCIEFRFILRIFPMILTLKMPVLRKGRTKYTAKSMQGQIKVMDSCGPHTVALFRSGIRPIVQKIWRFTRIEKTRTRNITSRALRTRHSDVALKGWHIDMNRSKVTATTSQTDASLQT